jgi:hypothetical protein
LNKKYYKVTSDNRIVNMNNYSFNLNNKIGMNDSINDHYNRNNLRQYPFNNGYILIPLLKGISDIYWKIENFFDNDF